MQKSINDSIKGNWHFVKILLVGRNGQLGSELSNILLPLGNLIAMDFPEIDLALSTSIRSVIRKIEPDLIINAAAYTNVDKAETEVDLVRAVNTFAPGVMAEEAQALNASFIHYSTDYIFDGTKGEPYIEWDTPNPLNIYGSSKLEGEALIQKTCERFLIFRTSWLYSLHHDSFVTRVLRWAHEKETVRIAEDQIGCPTWARTLAETTVQVLSRAVLESDNFWRQHSGIYHLGGAGWTTRYEWARQILSLDPDFNQQALKELLPAKTSDFPTPAIRPLNTSLSIRKFQDKFNLSIPPWEECLIAAFSS
jgi:dTDP-4-dehydrorhamnose reductase